MARSDNRANRAAEAETGAGDRMRDGNDPVPSGAVVRGVLGHGLLGRGARDDQESEGGVRGEAPASEAAGKRGGGFQRDRGEPLRPGDPELGDPVLSARRVSGESVGAGGQGDRAGRGDLHRRREELPAVGGAARVGGVLQSRAAGENRGGAGADRAASEERGRAAGRAGTVYGAQGRTGEDRASASGVEAGDG